MCSLCSWSNWLRQSAPPSLAQAAISDLCPPCVECRAAQADTGISNPVRRMVSAGTPTSQSSDVRHNQTCEHQTDLCNLESFFYIIHCIITFTKIYS